MPHGLHASISHCETFVATVATKAPHIRGLGVDIELTDHVTPDLTDAVLTQFERENRQTRTLACYFSAKEAVFKAVHGLIGKYIDFLEIELTFRLDRFAATPLFCDAMLKDIHVAGCFTGRGRYGLAIAWASSVHASTPT